VLLASLLPLALLAADRPANLLVITADDMSWSHMGCAGSTWIRTPALDRIAREGVRFTHAFAASPVCTPTRSALLTGLHPWQTGEGMQLLGTLPPPFPTFPNALEDSGWTVGFTGKVWGPGNWRAGGRTREPGGAPFYGAKLAQRPTTGIGADDLPANLARFLAGRPAGAPFCFWLGSTEPHVPYEAGSGIRAGLDPARVVVPPFLPDTPTVRSDLCDYALEIEHLDRQVAACLHHLETAGVLDDTLIVFYGDNGMPFPHAKHTCYDYGIRVPLLLRWGRAIPPGQVIDGLVTTPDLTATIYDAAGIAPPAPIAGTSLLPGLRHPGTAPVGADAVVVGHERSNLCRADDAGYPIRALRTRTHLFIRNAAPDRAPVGDAPAYLDIDPLPLKDELIARRDDPAIAPYAQRILGLRPALELYDLAADPGCIANRAARQPDLTQRLSAQLDRLLEQQQDPARNDPGHFDRMPPRIGRKPAR
jgi:uncharacterized sulfatase